ncbi:Asp/Glu racemase [Roseibium sp.]|uniref:maleate cis-trans isomerase family protein n=1 Tax=Roseibium sp. TaxID=1936156 RepID=UPI003A978464
MRLSFQCDNGCAGKAAIGLIILQADETLEQEVTPLLCGEGIAVYHSRLPSAQDVTPETLNSMRAELPRAASLLPSARTMDVVAYCCTSGATVIGPEGVNEAVQQYHPDAIVTDPMTAVVAACRHLGVKRLGLVTPYVPEVSSAVREKLREHNITTTAFGSFEQQTEEIVARIDASSVKDAICKVGASEEVEAVFASCTNLRTFKVIAECETELAKPVISSNQALAWHILRCAGLETKTPGPGKLFSR